MDGEKINKTIVPLIHTFDEYYKFFLTKMFVSFYFLIDDVLR